MKLEKPEPEASSWDRAIGEALLDLEARGLSRRPLDVEGPQGRTLRSGGRELLNFCSNDYLGLAAHPRVVRAAAAALEAEGWGSGASRLVSGGRPEHRELEAALAGFKGREAAVSFASGYQANLAAISALAGPGDVVFCDRLCHASLIDGVRLSRARLVPFAHGDLGDLERLIVRESARAGLRRMLVVSESVFSMDGDLAELRGLRGLCDRRGALLYLDEAHALGVLGREGRGLEYAGEEAPVLADLVMASFSKAFGGMGAFVAGSRAALELILQRGRGYLYSTAPPAAAAAAVREALTLSIEEGWRREALHARVRQLAARLGRPARSPIFPVVLGESGAAMAAAESLRERGFLVIGIRPPTVPRGTARLRITLRADHTAEDVDRLAEALEETERNASRKVAKTRGPDREENIDRAHGP